MSQISSVSGDPTVDDLQLAIYVPPSPPTPIVGLLKGHVVCATGTTGTIPEVSAYADGTKTVLGVLVDNYAPDSNGFVQIAGETDLILAVTCLTPLTPANIGDPLFNVTTGRVDLTRAADTDPLVGSITFVDGAGNYKMVIQDDKPDSAAAGYTDWVAEDDATNQQTITNGYVLEFTGSNGIDTDATVANQMILNLPTTATDQVSFNYDTVTGSWKASENLVSGTEFVIDNKGTIIGFAGDAGTILTATGGFAYSDMRALSTGASGVGRLLLGGNSSAGAAILMGEHTVVAAFPTSVTTNTIQATALQATTQSLVLHSGQGTTQPTESSTDLALGEGRSVHIKSGTGSPIRTGKNLNNTDVYGGSNNTTTAGTLSFGRFNVGESAYWAGDQTTVVTDGTVGTAAEWYLGAGSSTGISIDYYSQFRVYRLTCSYQNSTDGVYQTETITIVSDLTTPTWSLSDFLSTGGAASEIGWDVDYVNPGGTSSVNYLRVRAYSLLGGKVVQFDISGQCIGGNLV